MKSRRGFLLLEVMVSLVVITGGLLFVMRVYSTAKDALSRSRDFFKYSLLLEEKMYDFEERGVIEEDKDQGHFPSSEHYLWEVEAVSMAPGNQSLSGLCEVKLGVFYDKNFSGGHPPEKYRLFTYLDKKK
jgi:Tfp pilus assembly protein PilV